MMTNTKNKQTHGTKACHQTPWQTQKMRRKTRPPSIELEVKPEPVDDPTNEAVPEQTENAEDTENAASTELALVTRRPRKKVRRPTLSDTVPAIPVAAFQRMVRHMAEDYRADLRWEDEALKALQADAEAFLVERFQKAKETTDLFGRSTTAREFACLLRV